MHRIVSCGGAWEVDEKRKTYPKDPRGVDDNEIPGDVRLMGSDKFPRGLLCHCLRGHINRCCSCCGTFGLHLLYGGIVPGAFIEVARHSGGFTDSGN